MRHCSEEESYVLYLLYRRITAILMLRLRRIIILFFHIFYKGLFIAASFPLHL